MTGPVPVGVELRDGSLNMAVYRIMKYAIWGVFRAWNRISVDGLENLPDGPCVWVPNHRSYIDTPIHAAIPARMRVMGKDSMWKYRFAGWLFTTIGCFPVNRDTADRAALRTALDALTLGDCPVVMFGEGERKDGPRVLPLLDGPVYLAGRAQVPIVPVGIGGTAAAMPRGAKFMYPRPIKFVIGTPMDPPAPGPSGRVSRGAIRETTEELRERVQEVFDRAQAAVGTPNVY
ncbi:lysophospholipid acyltransferase family protein [Candidatus Poriferisodalis sp.]|uniref:lysophospholipid acyltransferase family protein n=1 Tax=Candidatus Poriferisodalis sp. TaxID=3101277 RepID=UPI003B011CB5